MEYMNSLRQHVGHEPLLMIGATVLVLDEQGRLLMIRRSDSGAWGVPGGAMEPGEAIEETARRELKEETGLDLRRAELFGVFSGPELYHRYPNGDEVYNVSIVYLAHMAGGAVALGDGEHTEFAYFLIDELPADISPPIRPILKRLKERLSGAQDAS